MRYSFLARYISLPNKFIFHKFLTESLETKKIFINVLNEKNRVKK